MVIIGRNANFGNKDKEQVVSGFYNKRESSLSVFVLGFITCALVLIKATSVTLQAFCTATSQIEKKLCR